MGCSEPYDPNHSSFSGARPSVLLVTFDTLRADHLGAYGYPDATSRHFDALAEQGVVYERALAASARTAPSHASIMTSRFLRDHSIGYANGSTRLGEELTLARIFDALGYDTAAFVSNGQLTRRIGLDAGFEVFDDELSDRERNRLVFERRAERTAQRAVDWLSSATVPFFLWVHFNDPHGPYTPPDPMLRDLTGAAPASAPDRADEPLPVLNQQRGWHGIPAYQRLSGVSLPSAYRARYAGEVRYADQELGRVLEAARRTVGEKNLVIAVTADHGESLGEEGFYFSHGHATTPDLIRVPLLIVAPNLAPGRSPDLAHHVDVMPTLLDLVGAAPVPDPAGLALSAYWQAGEPLPDRVLIADVGAEVSGYRGDRFERRRLVNDLGNTPEGSRKTFRWNPDAPWHEALPDPEIQRELDAYVERDWDLESAAAPTRDDLERLRALGYLEPTGDEPARDAR